MANTVIGSSISIDGEISGEEALIIQGTVKGKIALAESLHVENGGIVEADIETQTVTISGHVTGNIQAKEKVDIRADGKMVGDIKSPRITIAEGAAFKGSVDMDV